MLCLAGVIAAQPGAGQKAGAIVGQVFDSDLTAPIEYANVVLYALPESTQVTGTVTDKTGAFRLDGVKPGRYYVVLSFVGYRDRTMKEIEVTAGTPLDLGRIELELKPISVPGVEASAEKPAISFEPDKKVIDVSKLPTASSGTAVDALQSAPSVKVDIDGNVTLRGSSNFTVLVDGRPTPLSSNEALRQIPAATIDKIEVITNPSVKYAPDGAAGIINVLLKKEKGRGISALANADAGLRNRYNGDALLSVRRGIVSAYAGGQLGRREAVNSSESETRTFGGGETLSVVSSGSGSWKNRYAAGRAGLDLQFGPRDRSSISGRFGTFDGDGANRAGVEETRLPADSSRGYLNQTGWQFGSNYWFAMLDHEHQFDTTENKLTGRAVWIDRGGLNASRTEELDSTGRITTGRRVEEPGPFRELDLTLDYALLSMRIGKIDAGYAGQIQRVDQDYRLSNYNPAADSYELDGRSSHRFYGTQDIHSLYAMYGMKWKQLGVQPGLRGEYGTRHIEVLDTALSWHAGRWDYFPSFGLSYDLPASQQLTAAYSRRIERPDPWQLRPFPVWDDAHTVSVGNPDLRPEYINSWEAGYELPFGANQISLQAYLRTTSDMVEDVTKKYPGDTAVLLQVPENIGRDRSLGLEFSASVSPAKWFSAFLTGDASDYHEDGALDGLSFSRTDFYWTSSLRLTFTLPTNTQVQLNGRFNGPSINAQGSDDAWFTAGGAVKQFLFNRALSITFRGSNMLGAPSWKSRSHGAGFTSTSTYASEGYIVALAVSYNFNNFKLDQKMRAGEGIEQEGAPAGATGGRR